MSKVGKQPIEIPEGVKVDVAGAQVSIAGPKGTLGLELRPEVKLVLSENKIYVKRANDSKMAKSLHGLFRTLIANSVTGVTQGWEKTLEVVGTGFGARVVDSKLILNLGLSYPVEFTLPADIIVSVSENKITVTGVDKAKVGEIAAKIRVLKRPDPYKGKGIRYLGEVLKLKPGKAAKAVGGIGKV